MLSIVVPTHNRAKSAAKLASVLDGFACSEPTESIFVLDGCVDDTRQTLQALKLKKPVHIIETPGLGAAAARNRGAEATQGDLLLFLDDDIIPQPGALDSHIRLHNQYARAVVVGPCPYAPEMPVNPLDFMIRDWWRLKIEDLSNPDHEFTYQDCGAGNLSLHKSDFEAVGGFDESFEKDGREDYELGVRLLKSGMQLKFARDAVGYHYPCNRPKSTLRKWYTFGRADLYFAKKHPELFDTLPLAQRWNKTRNLVPRLGMRALSSPINPQKLVSILGDYFERNLDRLWDQKFGNRWSRVRDLAYLLGAISAAGGIRHLDDFMKSRINIDELPRASTKIVDIDLFSMCGAINNAEKYDRILPVSRVGGSIVGWDEFSGRDIVSRTSMVERLAAHQGWPAWEILNNDCADSSGSEMMDALQTASVLGRLPINRSLRRDISVVVLSDGPMRDDCRSIAAASDNVICVDTQGGELRSKIREAVSESKHELVAILKPPDIPDEGWSERACRHFAEEYVSCVLTPVMARSINTRSEELYSEFVGFDRVRTWGATRISDWLSAAGILKGFAMPCHRMVMRKSAILAALEASVSKSHNSDDLATDILCSALSLWQAMVYDPHAVVWTEQQITAQDVQKMALEHHQRVYRMAAERISLRGKGRIRALRTLFTLSRQYKTHRQEIVNSRMSSGAYARRIARIPAALNGISQGLVDRETAERG